MKRLVVAAVAVVAALFVAANTSAATSVQKIPFEGDFVLCNGHTAHASGTFMESFRETWTPSGGVIFGYHANGQGIRVVDTTTGTVYHETGVMNEVDVRAPSGGWVFTHIERARYQATGGAESFILSFTMHWTVTPDGTESVIFNRYSSTC